MSTYCHWARVQTLMVGAILLHDDNGSCKQCDARDIAERLGHGEKM